MTLRTRIAAAAGLSVALAVVVVAVGLYVAVRADLRGEVDRGLRDRAQVLTQPLRGTIATGPDRVYLFGSGKGPPGAVVVHPPGAGVSRAGAKGPFPSRVGPVPFGGAPGYVQFIAPGGSVQVPGGQGSSTARIAIDANDRAIARRGSGSASSDRSVNGVRLRVLTEGVGGRGAVMVARPLGEVDSELSKLLLILVVVGACGIALAAALGALVARVALAPVSRFTARTEELSAESALRSGRLDLTGRLDVKGRDELGRLADSFNRALDALESSVESQRQLVADAGHELRTPIASLRANIQVLGEAERLPESERESLRADIVSELDELTALVADVVARGTVTQGRDDEVRLDAVVDAAIERARRRAPGMSFARGLEPTVVRGEAARIDRAVGNLLENARKWSPPEGPIEVGLRGGVVSVRDHGPGFAQEDLPHVFDRFYRADGARQLPGSGLGLAIVRQAAEAGGGWARAANAAGGGALLQVSFGAPVAFSAPQG
jgi:two-component system, OmpR family, sensor histidine kinase MprB